MTLDNPEFQVVEGEGDEVLHAGRIVPVYRLTAGLTAARLRPRSGRRWTVPGTPTRSTCPTAMRRELSTFLASRAALEEAHYPTTFERRDAALRRLAFDELLALQIGMVGRRRRAPRPPRRPIAVDNAADTAIRVALSPRPDEPDRARPSS